MMWARAINPQQVEGQIIGGVAQGLGLALLEEFIPGRTENLHDYLIATVGDVPEVEVHLIETKEPLGPFGAKGVGEHALIPTAPAILNALFDATGVRLEKLPAVPHRVHAALLAAGVSHDRHDRALGAREADGIVRCDACPVLCRIRPGRTGACSRYANENGALVRTDPIVFTERRMDEGGQMVPFAGDGWDGDTGPASRPS
jgi:hypothetical protein